LRGTGATGLAGLLTSSHHDRLVIDRIGPHLDPRVKVVVNDPPRFRRTRRETVIAPAPAPAHGGGLRPRRSQRHPPAPMSRSAGDRSPWSRARPGRRLSGEAVTCWRCLLLAASPESVSRTWCGSRGSGVATLPKPTR
jgi:hypothetical protein